MSSSWSHRSLWMVGLAWVCFLRLGGCLEADIRGAFCEGGSGLVEDGVQLCLFCAAETGCPIDAPHRLVTEDGIVCSTAPLETYDVSVQARFMLKRRCVDAGYEP